MVSTLGAAGARQLPVQATIWTSAVATRFEASRAPWPFAITLCGASIAVAIFPLMGSWLIGQYGWQRAARSRRRSGRRAAFR
ncbi:hypothetical protein [Sphingobium yanoikuyae]|uniref:hypothetical protein n=1 Tax=Sphingobium yanoikuyae TaxID=13690 RepID=UPI00345EA185